jgi:hypothetical protein
MEHRIENSGNPKTTAIGYHGMLNPFSGASNFGPP